jgi:hypothetical protein
MKRIRLYVILLLVCCALNVNAQQAICVDAVSKVSADSLIRFVTELTGRDSAALNGQKVLITSRYAFHPGNDVAAAYLKEKCLGYGFTAEDIPYSSTGRNIVMYKPGTVSAKSAYILCAHYDCVGTVNENFEGADDNASGVAALLEAARLFKDEQLPYTLVLAFWDEEEIGLVGSKAFAPDGPLGYWDVKGVINLDMIAYENNGDSLAQVHTTPVNLSVSLAQKVVELNRKFGINLNLQVKNPGETATDHQAFWLTGATAVGITEDYDNDFNPNWHKLGDKIETLDTAYFTKVSQLAIGAICEIAATGTVVGLEPNDALLQTIQAYPNPATQSLTIRLPNTIDVAECRLFDMYGAVVQTEVLTPTNATLNLQSLPPGVYVVEVRAAGAKHSFKLIHLMP